MTCDKTYAVKSAEAVAALEASGLNLACQTAPLWPMKVPILYELSSATRGQLVWKEEATNRQ